jgi:hypothetical protein
VLVGVRVVRPVSRIHTVRCLGSSDSRVRHDSRGIVPWPTPNRRRWRSPERPRIMTKNIDEQYEDDDLSTMGDYTKEEEAQTEDEREGRAREEEAKRQAERGKAS